MFVCKPADSSEWYIWIHSGALYWGKAADHKRWAIAAIWRAWGDRK